MNNEQMIEEFMELYKDDENEIMYCLGEIRGFVERVLSLQRAEIVKKITEGLKRIEIHPGDIKEVLKALSPSPLSGEQK